MKIKIFSLIFALISYSLFAKTKEEKASLFSDKLVHILHEALEGNDSCGKDYHSDGNPLASFKEGNEFLVPALCFDRALNKAILKLKEHPQWTKKEDRETFIKNFAKLGCKVLIYSKLPAITYYKYTCAKDGYRKRKQRIREIITAKTRLHADKKDKVQKLINFMQEKLPSGPYPDFSPMANTDENALVPQSVAYTIFSQFFFKYLNHPSFHFSKEEINQYRLKHLESLEKLAVMGTPCAFDDLEFFFYGLIKDLHSIMLPPMVRVGEEKKEKDEGVVSIRLDF